MVQARNLSGIGAAAPRTDPSVQGPVLLICDRGFLVPRLGLDQQQLRDEWHLSPSWHQAWEGFLTCWRAPPVAQNQL